jgi:L-2-hydroxyglutarate oxidase LhgO
LQAGSEIACNVDVVSVEPRDQGLLLQAKDTNTSEQVTIQCTWLINCAGLNAHHVARRVSTMPEHHIPHIWYAKGNYFTIAGASPFSRLIYPMPEQGGLGTHLTLDLAGQMRFGPDVEWLDHHQPDKVDYDVSVERSAAFVKSIQKYWPEVPGHLLQAAYSGVRAKLSGPGQPAQDFMIQFPAQHGVAGLINLFGIESPGLTSSLALAKYVEQALSDSSSH